MIAMAVRVGSVRIVDLTIGINISWHGEVRRAPQRESLLPSAAMLMGL